jgi:hypothetical protein
MATAVVLPAADTAVLEDGDTALLPKAKIEDGEEFVDLTAAEKIATPVEKSAAVPVVAPVVPAADADLPAELRGKSQADLTRMYREAQSLIGRQGTELGELRRRADQAIHTSLAALAKAREATTPAAAPAAPAVIDEADYFRAPHEAIARAIESSPAIKQIRETLGKAAEEQAISRATAASERFSAAHPDAGPILQDPEFRQWVAASRVRTDLLRRAHQHYDFDAGDEVFGTWKALKGVGKTAPAVAAVDTAAAAAAAASAAGATLAAAAARKRALAAAAVPSGGGSAGPDKGATRIFRRADVLKLMEEDPKRYEALSGEIEKAYRENRVR